VDLTADARPIGQTGRIVNEMDKDKLIQIARGALWVIAMTIFILAGFGKISSMFWGYVAVGVLAVWEVWTGMHRR